MKSIREIINTAHQQMKRAGRRLNPHHEVALVLSGGGARGLAHIGAIHALEAHGYHITSIAGTSMGAMVGGIYATGKLDQLEQLALSMTRKQLFQMVGLSPHLDHIATGQRLETMLDTFVGDMLIEQLGIPFCTIATDVVNGEEYVYEKGKLATAIRASISIPGFFKPVIEGEHIFVDGSVHNTLPLDRVARRKGDLLVAMNVSAPDNRPYTSFLTKYGEPENTTEKSIWKKIPFLKSDWSANYMNMALRIAKLSIQNNTMMAIRLTPPDIYADMPMNSYGLFDFDKAKDIIAYGRQQMDKAIEQYNR